MPIEQCALWAGLLNKDILCFYFPLLWCLCKDRAEKAFLSHFLSNIFPPCNNSVASPHSYWFTGSARDCQPCWFVYKEHLSITLPSISTSLGIARAGCSVMCLTIQQDLNICHSLILLSLSRLTCCNLPTAKSSLDGYMQIHGTTCADKCTSICMFTE